MKYSVHVRRQVKEFLERLAPESRRKLKLALRGLETEAGDRLALRERLSGYHRLRVGSFRVIYRYRPGRVIECVFVEERSLVYRLFEREVIERLGRADSAATDAAAEEAPGRYGVKRLARVRRKR